MYSTNVDKSMILRMDGGIKMEMNKQILDVIHAVISYKNFIIDDNRVTGKIEINKFDWYALTEDYYYTLPVPVEMRKNKYDLDKILSYRGSALLDALDTTEEKKLCEYQW